MALKDWKKDTGKNSWYYGYNKVTGCFFDKNYVIDISVSYLPGDRKYEVYMSRTIGSGNLYKTFKTKSEALVSAKKYMNTSKVRSFKVK